MLPKRSRLPVNHFPQKTKTALRGRYLLIKTIPNSLSYNRAGVVVNRQVSPKPTKRNRLRRRVFNFLKASPSWSKATPHGQDILIILGPEAGRLDSKREEAIIKELDSGVAKLKTSAKGARLPDGQGSASG